MLFIVCRLNFICTAPAGDGNAAGTGQGRKDWLPLRLKQQERRITGLVVRTAEGEEEEISARAVVLADGGFAGNEELLQDYAGLSGVRPRLEGGHHGIGL